MRPLSLCRWHQCVCTRTAANQPSCSVVPDALLCDRNWLRQDPVAAMALLAGLPLDVVDALSNGGACNAEDIASLRLACSTLRSQVDGTLQRLRPTCDLSALRVLPSTWRVVSCIDLSAIDLRCVCETQLRSALQSIADIARAAQD